MSEDQYRQLVRRGLAPLIEEVPEGPQWEELIAGGIVIGAPAPTRRTSGWLVGLGVSVVVLVLGGLVVLLSPSGPPVTTLPLGTIPPTTISFDGAAAAGEVETWWRFVIAGNVEAAVEMTHPDGQFNFEGLSEHIVSLGDAVVASAEPEVFGPENQPMVCYTLVGSEAEQSGAAVFRSHEGEWLLWEVRPLTVGCVDDAFTTTTLPHRGAAPGHSAETLVRVPDLAICACIDVWKRSLSQWPRPPCGGSRW
jgi:hypothetical protein